MNRSVKLHRSTTSIRNSQFARMAALPLLLSLIIAAGSARAESDNLPVPEFEARNLLNGMELLFLPSGEARVPFILMIKNGAAFDPVDKWGVTYLMVRMLLEGKEGRSGTPIQEDLKNLGVELQARVHWDTIYFHGSAPAAKLLDSLNLLAETVVRPKFEEEMFEQLRARILEDIEAEKLKVEVSTQRLFLRELFSGNPYGHSSKGTPETLKNLYFRDIKIQYRKLMVPNQAKLAFYHAGEVADLFAGLSRKWGSWVRKDARPFAFRRAEPIKEKRIFLLDRPGDSGFFRWGKLGVKRGVRDYYALKIVEEYLNLSLPTWAEEVASEAQIQALPSFETFRMPGYIQLSLQASSQHLVPYLKRFIQSLKELRDGQVDLAKFEEARQLTFLEFKRSLEDPQSRLFRLLDTSLYELGISYLTSYGRRLNRVQPKAIPAILEEYLSPDSFLLIVEGPASKMKADLEELGAVEILN